MKFIAALPVALLLRAAARRAEDHPVAGVIQLLTDLQNKVTTEGAAEEATYTKFKKWCDDSTGTLEKAVQSATETIDTLEDQVASKTHEQANVEQEIGTLTEQMVKYEADAGSAAKDREDAHRVWEEADQDFNMTIYAVDEAIQSLEESKQAALLQFLKPKNPRQEHALRQLMERPLVLEQLSDEQREGLTAAVFGGPVTDDKILAKAKELKSGEVLSFKSGNVVKLLTDMKTHFENQRAEAEKAETYAAHSYELVKTGLGGTSEAALTTKEGKETLLGEVEADLNQAEASLKDEKDELEADSTNLDDTKRTCDVKASQWLERVELRKGEIAAMKAAIGIMEKVSGVRTEAPTTEKLPVPTFLQVGSKVVDPKKMKAVNLIRQEAKQIHSKQLLHFADLVATQLDGPLDKMTHMVDQLIFKLKSDQTDEDDHKHWCDRELAKTEATQDHKSTKIATLDAKIKDANANVDELTLKITELNEKLTHITEFMGEATQVRQEGKKENELALKDAKDAQAAIAKAEAILSEFYKDSGMGAALLQQEPEPITLPEEPASWDSSYTGAADPTNPEGGIIAVLQATAADFAKMEADTRAQEITDQKQFEVDMKESDIDKAKTTKEAEMKNNEKTRTVDKINAMTKQLKHTQTELDSVDQYAKDLEPACVSGDSTYEENKKARDEEIEALYKAQGILRDAFKEKPELNEPSTNETAVDEPVDVPTNATTGLLQTIGRHA